MRTSVLSRSVIAVASLAIGSVALVAAPAEAAPPGVTKEQAMLAVNGFRSADGPGGGGPVSPEAVAATRGILAASCELAPGEIIEDLAAEPATTRAVVDGMLAVGWIGDANGSDVRTCLVGVTVATFAGHRLVGSGTVTADLWIGQADSPKRTTVRSQLSGDVSVTAPLSVRASDYIDQAMFSATGSALSSVTERYTSVRNRTKAEKRTAKKVYVKQLATAKKSLTKALRKAGSSPAKKKRAKQAYARKKATATSVYSRAKRPVRSSVNRIVQRTSPFAIVTPWVWVD
jgi:hypothetical protein